MASDLLRTATVAVRALLEVSVLIAVGYWGFTTGGEGLARIGLAVGGVLAVAVVWAAFGSPAAPFRVGEPWRLALSLGLFAVATLALLAADRSVVAAAFAALAVADTTLLYWFGWA